MQTILSRGCIEESRWHFHRKYFHSNLSISFLSRSVRDLLISLPSNNKRTVALHNINPFRITCLNSLFICPHNTRVQSTRSRIAWVRVSVCVYLCVLVCFKTQLVHTLFRTINSTCWKHTFSRKEDVTQCETISIIAHVHFRLHVSHFLYIFQLAVKNLRTKCVDWKNWKNEERCGSF